MKNHCNELSIITISNYLNEWLKATKCYVILVIKKLPEINDFKILKQLYVNNKYEVIPHC